MTKAKAEEGMPGDAALDRLARINAGLLPPQRGVLEADRHSYPCPPCRVHNGDTPTGGVGGGYLHERLPTK